MPAPDDDAQAGLRALPSVDRVMDRLAGRAPRPILAHAARAAVAHYRDRMLEGHQAPSFDEVVEESHKRIEARGRNLLRPLINATGVLVHTNLGRVPLGASQLEAIARVAGSYSNLEYDLEKGRRGSRYVHAGELLITLTGAEAALVVNNNAAALLLTLAGLCRGHEVVISRGELVEIGGEFRIPDVIEQSGARLVEVGTTNRTRLADYEGAIGPDTAALLRVHPSNYRIVGFTQTVADRELARLARARGLVFLNDLGSGLLEGQEAEWLAAEPPVGLALADGADVVTISGDKLLAGPQAGIILGRAELVERLMIHPLLRALRVDKVTLAALQATLEAYLEERWSDLPLWSLALTPLEDLETRALALAARLDASLGSGVKAEAVSSHAVTGGGSLPGTHLSSWAVSIVDPVRSGADIERRLRRGDPPVIARIDADVLLIDLRAVPSRSDGELAGALEVALSEN